VIVVISALLDRERLATVQSWLQHAAWQDGRLTAGFQSAEVKRNLQLPHSARAAQEAGELIVRALERDAAFISAALPRHVFPPLFNRYEAGMGFGPHVDNAIRQLPGTPHRLRTDLAATLFLSAPESYDGGELVVTDTFGEHAVKLAAGDMVVYPASSLHRVQSVTRGVRTAAFFWVQSLVRDPAERKLLYELDTSIRTLTQSGADSGCVVQLTACYHNLLRRWAEI
jgi:PKHD-type hydroxylase